MSIKVNDTAYATQVRLNGTDDVKQMRLNTNYVWCKPYSYTRGTLPQGVTALTCTRSSTLEPSATAGTLSNTDTVYHGDQIYWAVTLLSHDYRAFNPHTSLNPVTVKKNIVGITDSEITVEGSLRVNCTNCTADTATGWYTPTDSRTVTFTADTNWSFNGISTQDIKQLSTAIPGTISASPEYCYITVRGFDCTINVDGTIKTHGWSGLARKNAIITWTANTYYAFDSSGQETTRTATITGPNTYENSPRYAYFGTNFSNCRLTADSDPVGWYNMDDLEDGVWANWEAYDGFSIDGNTSGTAQYYSVPHILTAIANKGYYSLNLENCSYSSGSQEGWYDLGTTPSTVVHASYRYSFGGVSEDSTTISNGQVPTTAIGSPQYAYLTVTGVNCTATGGTTTSGYKRLGRYYTTFTVNSGYSFNSTGTQTTKEVSNTVPGEVRAEPYYGYLDVTLNHCSYQAGSSQSGWYYIDSDETDVTVVAVADNTYAFYSDGTNRYYGYYDVPATVTIEPGYGYLTVAAGQHCTATGDITSSGWKQRGSTYYTTFTADYDYAFNSNGDTTIRPGTDVPGSNNPSANYGHYRLNLTNCSYSSGTPAGWYTLDTVPSTVVYADEYYSFGGSNRDTITISPGTAVPVTGWGNPRYAYFGTNFSNCHLATGSDSIGWYNMDDLENGVWANWEADDGFAINGSTSGTAQYYSVPYILTAIANQGYLTVSAGIGCNATGDITTSGYKDFGTYYTTFTANSGYAFDNNGTATKRISTTVPGTNSAACTHGYYTVTCSHCTADVNSGWYPIAGSKTTTFTADSGYDFGSGITTTTKTASVPGSVSATATPVAAWHTVMNNAQVTSTSNFTRSVYTYYGRYTSTGTYTQVSTLQNRLKGSIYIGGVGLSSSSTYEYINQTFNFSCDSNYPAYISVFSDDYWSFDLWISEANGKILLDLKATDEDGYDTDAYFTNANTTITVQLYY